MYNKSNRFLLTLTMVILLLAGCSNSNKNAITNEVFTEEMKAIGLNIVDATNQFGIGDVDSVTIAEGSGYQIEFYVVPSNDQAINAFNENKTNFEALKGSLSTSMTKDIGNNAFYSLTTEDMYYFVSRIDNTFIYVEAPKTSKDDIDKAVKTIGY